MTLPKPKSSRTCSNHFRYAKTSWWTLELCLGWVSWILLGPVTLEGFGRLKLCLRLSRRMWLHFGRRYWLRKSITSCGRVTLGVWVAPGSRAIAKGWFPTHQCTGVTLTFWDSRICVFSCYWTVSYPFQSEHCPVWPSCKVFPRWYSAHFQSYFHQRPLAFQLPQLFFKSATNTTHRVLQDPCRRNQPHHWDSPWWFSTFSLNCLTHFSRFYRHGQNSRTIEVSWKANLCSLQEVLWRLVFSFRLTRFDTCVPSSLRCCVRVIGRFWLSQCMLWSWWC